MTASPLLAVAAVVLPIALAHAETSRPIFRVSPEGQLAVVMAGPGEPQPALKAMGFRAAFADGSPAFATERVADTTESGGARVYRFALSGPAAGQADVSVRTTDTPRGPLAAWTIRYRGEPKGFFPWTTGFHVEYASAITGATAQPLVRWVEPTGRQEWEVPGDAPYPDLDCQVRKVQLAGLPPLAFVTDWYDPDWIYGNDPQRAAYFRAGLPKDSPSETTYTFALLNAEGAAPEDLAALRQGRPVSLALSTGRVGNLFEPGEPLTLSARIANVTDGEVAGHLSVEVHDYYGAVIAREERDFRCRAGECDVRPLRLTYAKHGLLFVSAHLTVPASKPAHTQASFLTIGLLPRRAPTPPDPASPFGLAAVIANPGTYPDQFDLDTVLGVAERIGVRWVRTAPFPVKAEVTPQEEQAVRERVELFRRHGLSVNAQLGFELTSKPSWRDDLRASLARFRWTTDYVELGNELNPHSQPDEQRRAAREHVEQYLKPFHDLMREAHPNGKVMPFGLGGVEAAYLEGFGEAGGFGLADVMSIHPGSFPRAPEWDGGNEFWALLPQLRTLKAAMKRFGEKDFWITEMYAPTPPGKTGLDLRTSADYLVRTYMVCLDAGAKVIEWYQLQDGVWYGRVPAPTDVEHSFGLVYTDLSPKPAYLAFGVMTEELQGLRYLGRADLGDPELFACGFGRGVTLEAWVLWSYREKNELDKAFADMKGISRRAAMPWENRWHQPVEVKLAAKGPVRVTDIMGNATTVQPKGGAVALSLTGSPVFVRGLGLVVGARGG